MSLAAFIADQRTSHQVPHAVACRALTVSESWFYKWHHRSHQPSPCEQRRAELDAAVAEAIYAHASYCGTASIEVSLRRRHTPRLSRAGDRWLNRALPFTALSQRLTVVVYTRRTQRCGPRL